MSSNIQLQKEELFKKLKLISNKLRFKIIELTDSRELTITDISSKLNLAYTKCSDYIASMEREKLVTKTAKGKEVFVKSNIILKPTKIEFK